MSSNNSTISAANVQSALFSQYLSLTLGFVILIIGIIGNSLNILIFLTFGTYKSSACSQYMLAGSLFDLVFLLIGIITRILGQGFNLDFTLTSRVWCKLRPSILEMISLCSFTCLCLQSVDVFCCTSRSVAMRQRSNVKISRYLLIGLVLFWTVHELPSFIFQDLVSVNDVPMCLQTNAIYLFYHTYISTVGLTICVPIIVISVFGFCIYRNLRFSTLAERRSVPVFLRQITRMALFQIGIVLIFQCPYGVATAYFIGSTNLVKSPDRQQQDKLTQTFFNVYVYGLYAVRNKSRAIL
jgi:hypothetical protein